MFFHSFGFKINLVLILIDVNSEHNPHEIGCLPTLYCHCNNQTNRAWSKLIPALKLEMEAFDIKECKIKYKLLSKLQTNTVYH